MTSEIITTLVIMAALSLFGLGYAYHIAIRKARPARTWFDVVIGDLVTDIGAGLILYVWSGDIWLSLVPFMAHGLTGGPMILGQCLKYALTGRLNGHILKHFEEDVID